MKMKTSTPEAQGTCDTSRHVEITRTFAVPRERVFEAWTSPQLLEKWYAPAGCTISFQKLEFHEGGSFHSCIRSPEGDACWCIGVYHEISAPERIVFSMRVADAQGNAVEPSDAGMHPEWPAETVVSVFFEETPTGTRVTLKQTVSEALAKETGAYPSWLSMFDHLDALLGDASS